MTGPLGTSVGPSGRLVSRGVRLWTCAARNPVVAEALWVLPLTLVALLSTVGYASVPTTIVGAVQALVLVVRRTAPGVCASVVFVTGLAQWALFAAGSRETGSPLQVSDIAVLVALYSVAAHAPRRVRWATLAGGALGSVLFGLSTAMSVPLNPAGVDGALGVAVPTGATFALCLLAWTGGQLQRVRLAQQAATVEAAQRRQAEMEQRVLVAAGEERARIARELHDVVAHSLSVVIAQADGGRYAAADDRVAAVNALETVAATGRGALTDMRRLLGVLREGADVGSDEDQGGVAAGPGAPMAPQPGVADVAELVASVRSSGLDVALTRVGEPRTTSPGAGLALYRCVQESLTNVLKHAGPRAVARVSMAWSSDAVEVRVEDDGGGPGPPPPTSGDGRGQGLTGMRERAALFGGRVDAGPLPGDGFGVRLVLPLPTLLAPGVTPPAPSAHALEAPR